MISKFNAITVTQARTPAYQALEAHFALLAIIMKGTKGWPLVKVQFKLNNEIIHTTLSDYNGKAVCFVKKELLTEYQQVFIIQGETKEYFKEHEVVRRGEKALTQTIWIQVFSIISANLTNSKELIDLQPFEFYKNGEF